MSAPANFDRLGPAYRWLEYVALGPLLMLTRTHYLAEVRSCRRAWVLGDGDGRFTARLLRGNASVRIDAVDTSAVMLGLLEANGRRASSTGDKRVRVTQADALDLLPPRDTDLVVTHFFLDCLTQAEAERLIAQTATRIGPNALWLVSEFRVPPGPMSVVARGYIRLLYFAFRVLTGLRVTRVPDYATALARHGFVRVRQHHRLGGLLASELWQARSTEP